MGRFQKRARRQRPAASEPSIFTGRKNAYTCDTCGRTIVTVDTDIGTTPAVIGCSYPLIGGTDCPGMMMSHWYAVPPDVEAQYEWYRPSMAEALRVDRRAPGSLQHVANGGLFVRPIEPPAPTHPEVPGED